MSLARSGVGWMLARLGALAISWLASLYFARALVNPQASLGTYYAFETVVSFLVLVANGGLNGAIVKRVSEGEEPEEFATAGLLMSGGFVLVLSVIVILSTPLLVDFFGFEGLSVIILVSTLFAYQTRDTLSALLTSDFQLGRSGLVNFTNAAGQVSVQVALVSAGFGVLGLMTGYMAGTVVASLAAIGLVVRNFDWQKPAKRHFRSLLRFARYSFLNGFVQKFYDNVDIIIITALLGKAATGVYGIGFQFSLLLTVFYSAINQASNPEISKHHAQGNEDRIKEVFADTIVLGLLVGIPAFAGFTVLARPIIVTFYTEEFAAATLVAVGAVATRVPEGLRSSFGSLIGGIDRPDIVFRGGVILMATNLVLDIALVPTIGIVGAVVASFVGMTLQLLYMGHHLVDVVDFELSEFPVYEVAMEVVAATVMAGVVYTARTYVELASFVTLFALVCLGVVVYFSLILAIAPQIRSRLRGILGDVLFLPL